MTEGKEEVVIFYWMTREDLLKRPQMTDTWNAWVSQSAVLVKAFRAKKKQQQPNKIKPLSGYWATGKETSVAEAEWGVGQRAVGDRVRKVAYEPSATIKRSGFYSSWEIIGVVGEMTDMIWIIVLKNILSTTNSQSQSVRGQGWKQETVRSTLKYSRCWSGGIGMAITVLAIQAMK